MPRRTKSEALATRHQLLEAATRVFAEKGVSRTSLQDIAVAAGTTRGAIYWHFKNKADLFNAMMECAILPMEQAMAQIGHDPAQDPLAELEHAMLQAMRSIVGDARTRAIFEIATLKVEYVDELLAVKARHVQAIADGTGQMRRSLQEAALRRGITLVLPVDVSAAGLQALMSGLIHTWMLSPAAFDLVLVSQAAIRTYLVGLGLR
jgi:TetR/AcrR family acrAB operon transcriptional repressor